MTQRSLVALFVLLGSFPAGAQQRTQGLERPKPPEGMIPADDPAIAEREDILFRDDDPNAPDAVTADRLEGAKVVAKGGRPTKTNYPIEVVSRPLTLAKNQLQLGLDLPLEQIGSEGGPVTTQVLRAAYGVTQDIETGFTYAAGLARLAPLEGAKRYEPSKAFAAEVGYAMVPGRLAARLTAPFYADPFAWGLTFGVPFRISLAPWLALVGGHDLVSLRLIDFAPDAARPWHNLTIVEGKKVNVEPPAGNLDVHLGALLQARPNLAFTARLGLDFPDFDDREDFFYADLTCAWSKDATLDIGARLGIGDFNHAEKSLAAGLFAAFRL